MIEPASGRQRTATTGGRIKPLHDVHRDFVLGSRVLHADETPVGLLDPGAGKTKKAYMCAYAQLA